MSIVPLKKVTICGLLKEKQDILAELQAVGCMHLESLRPAPTEPEKQVSERAKEVRKALRYLLEAPRKRRQVRNRQDFDVAATVESVEENMRRTRKTGDERDFIARRIKDLQPWGNFVLPEPGGLRGRRLWFYILPHKDMQALYDSDLTWAVVHRTPRISYVVVIAEHEPDADALPVRRTHTGAVSISGLREQLEALDLELEKLASERETLTRWIFLLSQNLNRSEDRASMRHAMTLTRDTEDGIFALQGWAPTQRIGELENFVKANDLALMVENPAADEHPPTLMENPEKLRSGELLVSFYQTPAYREWDPSSIVLFSFAIFFSMILADAGYALVLCLGLALYWRRLGEKPNGQQIRSLLAIVFGAAVVFGVLVGSFFGLSPPEDSVLGHLHVLDINNYNSMITLSVVIGCLHVALANALAARHARNRPARIMHLAWIALVLGGLFLWLGRDPAASGLLKGLGIAMIVLGLVALIGFASDRPVHSAKDALLRAVDGLKNLTDISRAFGDVLSYMRLFALGLASASMAMTFNTLATDVYHALPGLGLLFAILILIFGHLINLVLCIVGGVVHGLRLNVIEFFNWGLSEEGRPFKTYARKEAEQ